MAFVFKDSDKIVTSAIDGMLLSNPHLTRLDGYPDIKVVLRRDWDTTESKVAIISGGGSGHEPAHVGYVGRGMLTAAVCGEVFASPSVDAVLAAIRSVATPAGVLLIIKNYTGDRLNFGLAAEQAKSEGIRVETVFVADDCAIEATKHAGRRGIAGTIFVHKIAGAAAEEGKSLIEVAAHARAAAEAVGSMGFATSTCNIPGQPHNTRLDDPETMEIGLGIHGEPGMQQTKILPPDAVAERLVERVVSVLKANASTRTTVEEALTQTNRRSNRAFAEGGQPANRRNQNDDTHDSDEETEREEGQLSDMYHEGEDSVVVLINNLGGCSQLETESFANTAVAVLKARGVLVCRVYVGLFMTSLDMKGISISIMPVNEQRLTYLDAPTTAHAWPTFPQYAMPSNPPIPDFKPSFAQIPSGPSTKEDTQEMSTVTSPASSATTMLFLAVVKSVCETLIDNRERLNELDSFAGDGDCGDTMHRGAKAILKLTQDISDKVAREETQFDVVQFFGDVANACRRSMGGTSGVLYAIFFSKFRNVLLHAQKRQLLRRAYRRPSFSAFETPTHELYKNADHSISTEDEKDDNQVLHLWMLESWAGALRAAVHAIARYGNASPGGRTMIDALYPAEQALRGFVAETTRLKEQADDSISKRTHVVQALNLMANSARAGANSTKEMTAAVGRASYTSAATQRGHIDAGAFAVQLALEGAVRGVEQV